MGGVTRSRPWLRAPPLSSGRRLWCGRLDWAEQVAAVAEGDRSGPSARSIRRHRLVPSGVIPVGRLLPALGRDRLKLAASGRLRPARGCRARRSARRPAARRRARSPAPTRKARSKPLVSATRGCARRRAARPWCGCWRPSRGSPGPSAPPTCCAVLIRPEARPASCGLGAGHGGDRHGTNDEPEADAASSDGPSTSASERAARRGPARTRAARRRPTAGR